MYLDFAVLQQCISQNIKPHRHDFYELHYILNGSAVYRMNDRDIPLKSGDILITLPGECHYITPSNFQKPCAQFLIFFHMEKGDEVLREKLQTLRDSESVINYGISSVHTMQLIQDRYQSEDSFVQDSAQSLFKSWLYELLIIKNAHPEYIAKSIAIMHEKLHDKIVIEELCETLGMSVYHFSRVFKKHLGETPAKYFNRIKTQLAKSYLTQTRLTNQQIAECMGYANEFHFSRSFKQHTGLSPRQFRGILP
jgi:AraC-like DNA-binding protein